MLKYKRAVMMAAEVAPGAGHGLHHLPLSTPVLIEVLGYIPGLRYFSTFYKFIIHTAGKLHTSLSSKLFGGEVMM